MSIGKIVVAALTATIAVHVAEAVISEKEMAALYERVKTPYKTGIVLAPEEGHMVDNPCVYRHGGRWYMLYIDFDGKGYETHLAESGDLVNWRRLGVVLHRGAAGKWDAEQSDMWPILLDAEWEGSNELKKFGGKYWGMYIGGAKSGYETDPLSTGVAWTDDPSAAREWTRHSAPVMGPTDADARQFERKTLYKHFVVEDERRSLGGRFVSFYNAKEGEPMTERIGAAVSDDLMKWRRCGEGAVIDDIGAGRGISGDPMIRRIDGKWVMFYFGFMWKAGVKGAFDTFAASEDLKEWTKWRGDPLVRPSEPWDAEHAHKPWVIRHDGVVYHFYCAVGSRGRAIALATSKPLRGK